VSFLGGFVSSASASALVKLPIVYRTAHQPGAFRRLLIVSAMTTAIGLVVLAVVLLLIK
jgi:F0F1-type ATP synthase membrane subunit c/vacuolar-type H+-ATPase subunit K